MLQYKELTKRGENENREKEKLIKQLKTDKKTEIKLEIIYKGGQANEETEQETMTISFSFNIRTVFLIFIGQLI